MNLRRKLRFACVMTCLLLMLAVAYGQERIVAIGDVHGAYPEFVSILQRTGLINANRQWTGSSAILVQTGDVVDRGPRTRECLDLLMSLQRKAPKPGGKVIPLLGNHEVLNILGDVRYITPDIFRSFSDSRSEKRREQAYREYVKFSAAHKGHSHTAVLANDEVARQKWMERHPAGFFEYRDAMGPEGKYGTWLRAHRAIVKVGDGIFVHGGLNPTAQFRDIGDLEKQILTELAAFDALWEFLVQKKIIWRYMTFQEATLHVDEELRWILAGGKDADPNSMPFMQQMLGVGQWMINNQEGPLWYRGLAQEREDALSASLEEMLARLKAQFIVAGHTVVSRSEITPRFNNRVFLIDVGMLREVYEGRAAALEISKGKITAYYSDGEPKILVAPK